jgi:uncharacterized protein (DUF2336 family)
MAKKNPKLGDLAQLQILANNRGQVARQALFEKVVGLVTQKNDDLDRPEFEIIDEILVDLIKYVELTVRAKVSERLSNIPDAPHGLIRHLAADEIDVATPVLARSAVLTDDDLVDVANTTTKNHRRLVARRPNISESVSEALISKSEIDVVTTLLGNQSAKISRKSMVRLVRASDDVEPLRKPLLERDDLPTAAAYRLFWSVSGALRAHILSKFSVDPSMLDQVLEEAVMDGLHEIDEDQTVSMALKAIAVRGRFSTTDIVSEAKSLGAEAFAATFAGRAGVSLSTARRILADDGGDALAVACKSMELDKAQFTNLFLVIDFARTGKARPAAHLQRLSDIFDAVLPDGAVTMLRLWDCENRGARA